MLNRGFSMNHNTKLCDASEAKWHIATVEARFNVPFIFAEGMNNCERSERHNLPGEGKVSEVSNSNEIWPKHDFFFDFSPVPPSQRKIFRAKNF